MKIDPFRSAPTTGSLPSVAFSPQYHSIRTRNRHGPNRTPDTTRQPTWRPLRASVSILTSGLPASLRGLSAVNDKIIWVSGSNGTVGKSLDGGKTWSWMTVPGFEKRDFRDIEAFDAKTAIIMAIATPQTF